MANHFYFTYGCEKGNYPFEGGWTEVIAPDLETAIAAFRIAHPHPYDPEIVNCCMYYSEASFKSTAMYRENKNCGYGCHERITYSIEPIE